MPPGRGEKNLPLVLLPHGGPHGVSDTWFFDNDAQFLASRGYAVLQVNFRGSGGRGTRFLEAGYRQWGGAIQDDLIDGVKWATEKGIADASRVCSYGASFGAYSALMVAIRSPGLLRCAVGYAGVYDLPHIYEEEGTRRSKRNQNYFARAIGRDAVELAAFSPSRHAKDVKVPVLLVHGEEDKTAPPEHAKLMREALVKNGNAPEWMMVPREGHGFYAKANRLAFYKKLEEFLAKHLSPQR
jgi:dipeptidyl aminopeptidase/acylaminoacyl peptidase